MVTPRAAVVPLREEAREGAEQLTQLLFGEPCELTETQERWVLVRSLWDGQKGWADRKMMTAEGENPPVPRKLTMGSLVDGRRVLNGSERLTEALPLTRENLLRIYEILADTPYLWGGKSQWGMDCSGMTQVVFSLFGINLLRNASEQVTQGTPVVSLADSRPGDLVFFDHADRDPQTENRESITRNRKISHVGILLSSDEVWHCSGWVRRDAIDPHGIRLPDGSYTHHLAAIRRYRG